MTAGKGSKQRPTDMDKFNEGFDRIFVIAPKSTMYEDLFTPVDAGDCKLITGEIGTIDCGITFKKGGRDGDVKHRPGG